VPAGLAQRARIVLLAAEVPPNAEIARRVVTRQTVISWRGGPCVRRRIGGPVRADDVNVEEWVREVFAPVFSRSIGGPVKWCAQWWAHGEAVLRLEALWRSWEIHRLDPGRRMATWLRDFADNQLAALLADGGTFRTCTPDSHLPMAALPLTPATGPGGLTTQRRCDRGRPGQSSHYHGVVVRQEHPPPKDVRIRHRRPMSVDRRRPGRTVGNELPA
jgi:hypothetical protein